MSGTLVTGTYLDGVSLASEADNPATFASSARVSNSNSAAVYGAASVDWNITNAGSIAAGGTSAASIGITLGGGGTISNLAAAAIAGYAGGVSIATTAEVVNEGAISATATAERHGFGVRLGGGTIDNVAGGSITANFVAAYLTAPGSLDNAGALSATATDGYALAIAGAGGVYNAATGTITAGSVGVALTGPGSVTNLGSIASTQKNDTGQLIGHAGIQLRDGGSVVNGAGARISSQWIGVQIGQTGTSAGGTVTNQGTIFAGDAAGDAGAAVWMHGPGLVLNEAGGAIEGGPYGVVAYYDTTIVNSGRMSGTQFAVFQSSTAASDLVQVAPGASFSGIVEGGATAASAAAGALELLAGSGAGAISGFGTQYVGFAEVEVDAGATWSLAGTVTHAQTLAFGGAADLTLADPTAMAGTIDGLVPGDSITLAGITGVTHVVVDPGDELVAFTAAGAAVTLQLDPARHDPAGTKFAFEQSGGATVVIACFAAGTRIATPSGEVPVEFLSIGQAVRSPWGEAMPVRWLGFRHVDCARHPRPADVWPVRVSANAFRPGVPARDLFLSADHAIFLAPPGQRPVLIPVRCLIDGASIARERATAIGYWHVELERHAVVLAEGLPCETFLDTGNRAAFANGGPAPQLHPEFASAAWDARACAPQVRGGPVVDWARALLAARRRDQAAAARRAV
jgi:hypothetical protein